jgi:nucleoside-diphosphate-sugar epimerase
MDTRDCVYGVSAGNPGEFTMLELAHMVQKVVNPKAGLVYRENTADDPTKRKPDITKAKRDLHWEPTVKLEQGLELMKEDFRKRVRLTFFWSGRRDLPWRKTWETPENPVRQRRTC